MNEETMRELAKGCDNCINWVPVCNAVCCRLFLVQITKDLGELKKGNIIRCKVPKTPPFMKNYYKLHGAKLERGVLTFKLDEFQIVKDTLFVLNRCENLTEDLKCKVHGTDQKPFVCKDFTVDTYGTNRYYNPPNCLLRFKKEIKK